jgi:hypothetical protein
MKYACFVTHREVYRVLTEQISPTQAAVLTVNAFIAEQEE